MKRQAVEEHVPEYGPPIAFIPGRHYVGLWSAPLPMAATPGKGGDLMACVWRKAEEPDKFHMLLRFRYYAVGPNADPHEERQEFTDKKNWYKYVMKIPSDGEAEKTIDDFFRVALPLMTAMVSLPVANVPDFYRIQGDNVKAITMLRDNPPPWMHLQTQVTE